MSSASRLLRATTLAALVLCGAAPVHAQAPAAGTLPAISAFFGNSPFGEAKLSPSARFLAIRASAPGRRDFLLVVDLQTNVGKVAATFSNADVGDFKWVNDRRLLFDTRDKNLGIGNWEYAPGLYAVDRDGERFTELADRTGNLRTLGTKAVRKVLPWNTFMLDQDGAQDSDYVYAVVAHWDTKDELKLLELMRVNTVTGQFQPASRPGDVREWMLDHQGEPRLATTLDEGRLTLHYRDPASDRWRILTSFPAYGDGSEAITPIGFGPDGSLFVEARTNGDTTALHTFNLGTGKVDPEPILVARGYDFDGKLVTNRDKVLGVHFRTDAVSNEWFDTGMKKIQAAVDKLLPQTVNTIAVPAQGDSPWSLVTAYSDAVPATYFLYNKDTGLLNKVGESFPAINPAQMGRQQFVRYKARDGLDIPALLTLPPGGRKTGLPLVVLVHGGPYVRGASWAWRPQSQFLATRGYAVLEPEFRGSTGFGIKHFKAGFKQWGLAMQNDIADGARWAVREGIVDPERICIAGASYGGHAALMGLVNDPDLYKCGINWVGVTDINLMFDNGWNFQSDLPEEWKVYGMPVMIGDPVKDAAQFKATSPIQQAARITQPVLLAYGGVDARVPINHGTQFRNALMRTNKNVEWVEYPEEGHGWALEKNRIDFWSRVERFLDKHIGKAAKP